MMPPSEMGKLIAQGSELLAQVDKVLKIYERMRRPEVAPALVMPELLAEISNLKQVRKRWGS